MNRITMATDNKVSVSSWHFDKVPWKQRPFITTMAAFRIVLLSVCLVLATFVGSSFEDDEIAPKLIFKKPRGKANLAYAKMLLPLPELMEFTLCYWMKPMNITSTPRYVFSYSGRKTPHMFMAWYKAEKDGETIVGVSIADGKHVMSASSKDIQLNKWAHVCFAWSSWGLTGMVYVNGEAVRGSYKQSFKFQQETELMVKTGGVVVLGQEQKSYGGGFDINSCFIGELQGLQLWDEKLVFPYIRLLSKKTSKQSGNLIAWMKSAMLLKDVAVEKSDLP